MGSSPAKVEAMNKLSESVFEQNHTLAFDYANGAMELAKEIDDQSGLARAYYNLGRINANYTLNFYKAFAYLSSAQKINNKQNKILELDILMQMAFVNKQQQDFTKALDYYSQSLNLATILNRGEKISRIYSYMADIYEQQGDIKNTLSCLEKIIDRERLEGFRNTQPKVFVSFGHYFELKGQYGLAETYLKDALKDFIRTNNYRWASYTHSQLSKVAMLEGNNNAAVSYANQGLALAKQHGLSKELSDNLYALAEVYEKAGDFKNAFVYYKALHVMEDSVFNLEKAREMAGIEAAYENHIKEEQIANANLANELKENRLKKTTVALWATIVCLFLVTVLFVLLYRNYKIKKNINSELKNRDELKSLELDEIIRKLNSEVTEHELTKSKLEVINAELNNFMFRSSHDLKAPLASIAGLTNLATGNISERERLEYLSLISKSTSSLRSLLDDLVNAAKVTHGNPEPVDINFLRFVYDITEQFKNSYPLTKINIEFEVPKNFTLSTDKNLFTTIMHNLIENALKYSKPGISNAFVKIKAERFQRTVKISIVDNGVGIPEESLPHVFDMFVRANNSISGTGLGLYLVKKAVTRLGGSIALKSVEGEGTSVEMIIPELTERKVNVLLFDTE